MVKYLSEMDEAKLIQNLIKAEADDYYLLSLIPEKNIRTDPVGFCHEVPAIHIVKTGGSEENVLGNAMAGGKGNFQVSAVLITIICRRNIRKVYNNIDTTNNLAAALNITDVTFTLTGVTGIVVNNIIQVDDEKMKVKNIAGNVVTVYSRGFLGTTPSTHLLGADIFRVLEYEGINLCKKIRDIVKQIMFDNHSYYDESFPDTEFILENMVSDSDTKGIQSYGALFTSELRYSITFEINR